MLAKLTHKVKLSLAFNVNERYHENEYLQVLGNFVMRHSESSDGAVKGRLRH